MVPVKGYDLLIAAVATLADMPWRLTIAGDRTRDLATAARLDAVYLINGPNGTRGGTERLGLFRLGLTCAGFGRCSGWGRTILFND